MPFTAQELANIASATLDFYVKGQPLSQIIQERPTYNALRAAQKTFPGGQGNISIPVKGAYTTTIMGYQHDDTVTYGNPANMKRVVYPWKEIHAGIEVTLTELKKGGISVVDSTTGKSTTQHSDQELVALSNLFDDKLEDMAEGWARSFQGMLWQDGTQDAKQVPGILALLSQTPTSGSVGGIDRAANTWWQNRVALSVASNIGTWANQPLVQKLQKEYRQLRRFGGRPNKFYAGSDFMDAFEGELRAKGNYTLEGWSKSGSIDASVADLKFKGTNIEYEPTLDDIGQSKFGYWLDMRRLKLWVMDGEDMKTHAPARPAEKYVLYRAMTWTGGLAAQQLNCHGVYSIA